MPLHSERIRRMGTTIPPSSKRTRNIQRQLARVLGSGRMTIEATKFGPWTVAATLALTCQFTPRGFLSGRIGAVASTHRQSVVATVEVRMQGGIQPHALLGGRLSRSRSARLEIAVADSGDLVAGMPAVCKGLLGKSLVTGLPSDFARGALSGLVEGDDPLPGGRLDVIAGGYDDVDSSPFAFERAGILLRAVLSRTAAGEAVDSETLASVLSAWSMEAR